MIRTVSHAFGLMARNALIASLERRAGRKSIRPKLFFWHWREMAKVLWRLSVRRF